MITYRIYRAAVEQTRSMRAGGKTIICDERGSSSSGGGGTGGAANGSSHPQHQITLRMHRGGNTISGAHGFPVEGSERSKFFGRPSKSESSGELSSTLSLKRKIPVLSKQATVDQFGVDRTTAAAWNFSRKVSKLARERKAAKTLVKKKQ